MVQEILDIHGSESSLKSAGVVSSVDHQYDRMLKKRNTGFICDDGMSAFCTAVISEMKGETVKMIDPLWAQRVFADSYSSDKMPRQFQEAGVVYVPVIYVAHW